MLAALRANVAAKASVELRELELVVAWCSLHASDVDDESGRPGHEEMAGLTLGGPGTPSVSEDAIVELAAVLGKSTAAGKHFVARAMELRHRLPELWSRVATCEVPTWRAMRIAEQTLDLPVDGAAYVDRAIAPVAGTCSWAQLERTAEAAKIRFDPVEAERARVASQGGRCLRIALDQPIPAGTVYLDGVLGVDDAIDVENAVAAEAEALAQRGSTDPLEVRRSNALGNIARAHLALSWEQSEIGRARKPLVVHVHAAPSGVCDPVGRCEATRSPINLTQIKSWCSEQDRRVTIRPVLDLAEHHHVERYEVPQAIRAAAIEIDQTCVFPHCTWHAAGSDLDHIEPYPAGAGQEGGRTSSDNIAPLCRRHHRHKTFTQWQYRRVRAGTYLWTSPHRMLYLRDQFGTIEIPRE